MKLSDSSIPLPSVGDPWLECDKLAWEKRANESRLSESARRLNPVLTIQGIQKARAKITADGNWEAFDKNRTFDVHVKGGGDVIGWDGFDSSDASIGEQRANARFIANAPRYVDFLLSEVNELRLKLTAIEEREAAVCPEDVPFDEYVRSLQKQLEAARKGSPLHVNEANVLRAPDVEDCPDFKLPAHFTFDPHNKEEQTEIQRRAELHMQTCTRCVNDGL